ncbi:MAG TPA: VOC family protein [Actinomycetota bacterium]|nr:VOC family protein [Actinomycetota bacterium]
MSDDFRVDGILETVVYCTSENESETRTFYEAILGLRPVGLGGAAFRVAPGQMLLLFNADHSSIQDDPPPHGATGRVHTCFLVAADAYEGWKGRLRDKDVNVTRETTWPNGVHSFYFEDPAGNVLEIADGDLWPR